jgi:hypothetical protein
MTQYRVTFWVGAKQYITVIGATNLESLKKAVKRQYNRYRIEEIA